MTLEFYSSIIEESPEERRKHMALPPRISLKAARINRDLTQEEAAKELDFPRAAKFRDEMYELMKLKK